MDRIPFVRTIEESNAKLLRAKYLELMKTHDPVEWVRVIKTVHLRANAPGTKGARLSETERSFAESAKHYLYTELAIALDVSTDRMEDYITEHVQTME